MDRYHRKVAAACAQIEQTHDTAAARLLALIAFYRGALNGGTTLCLCVALTTSRESLSNEVKGKINLFRGALLQWLDDTFTLGQGDESIRGVTDPYHDARATLALLEGAHLAARAEENISVFDAATHALQQRSAP
ncbi:hypothetical protein [Roseibium salinum]|uniref:TetR family transcriptional regulator n=1 Tax=Roseibium salinum TaxID=1604349 RepID=A0ABT3QV54_9HYPH|nr:hypothetical protein [Roseibium sp. DSM 29163]MCX2720808.1 hypothetical protein [Roseibium sp. DSM 29163]